VSNFKGLKAELSGNVCGTDYHYELFIRSSAARFKMTIEPEFNYNGAETFSGILPREYKQIRSAKGAATKLFGEGLNWKNIE
jgi:hypothetical protein